MHYLATVLRCQPLKLFGGLEHFVFSFHILGIILTTDFHIFQRGRYTMVYHQPDMFDESI